MPHKLRDEVRDIQKSLDINASFDAHLAEHIHNVLGSNVARRTRREWATTKPTNRSIKGANASIERSHDIRQSKPACIVEVRPKLEMGMSSMNLCEDLEHLAWMSNTNSIA